MMRNGTIVIIMGRRSGLIPMCIPLDQSSGLAMFVVVTNRLKSHCDLFKY